MALGINRQPRILLLDCPKQGIDLREGFDLVAEKFDTIRALVVSREHLNHVAAHAECPAPEVRVIALVKNLHQPPCNIFAADVLPLLQQQQHPVVSLRRSQAVDAAHRANNDRVPPLEQRPRSREPQLVEFFINGGFLLDVEIPCRNVGLGLVVVVVANKVLDCIRREELLELVIKLRCQRLVVRQNQRRPVRLLNDLRHRESLARPGNPQQHLVLLPSGKPLHNLLDSPRLIPPRLIARHKLKVHDWIIREERI